MTKSKKTFAMTILTQKSHRRKMKYEATTEPNRDSISLMRISHGINSAQKLKNSRLKYLNFCREWARKEREWKWSRVKGKEKLGRSFLCLLIGKLLWFLFWWAYISQNDFEASIEILRIARLSESLLKRVLVPSHILLRLLNDFIFFT